MFDGVATAWFDAPSLVEGAALAGRIVTSDDETYKIAQLMHAVRATEGANPAEAEFLDVVRLWRVVPGTYIGEVIDAATQCLVAGSDTEALRELAGSSPRESRFVVDPLVHSTVEQLKLSAALDPDLERSAMLALARRLTRGRIPARELAAWALQYVGHQGSVECQPFVNFDDMYDVADYAGHDESALDAMVRQEAAAWLAAGR